MKLSEKIREADDWDTEMCNSGSSIDNDWADEVAKLEDENEALRRENVLIRDYLTTGQEEIVDALLADTTPPNTPASDS